MLLLPTAGTAHKKWACNITSPGPTCSLVWPTLTVSIPSSLPVRVGHAKLSYMHKRWKVRLNVSYTVAIAEHIGSRGLKSCNLGPFWQASTVCILITAPKKMIKVRFGTYIRAQKIRFNVHCSIHRLYIDAIIRVKQLPLTSKWHLN